MSIKYRIAILFSILVMLILTSVSVSIYYFSQEEREESFKVRMKKRALYSANIYENLTDSDYAVLRKLDGTAASAFHDKSISITGFNDAYVYVYADSTGDTLYLSRDVIEKTKINNEYYFTYKGRPAVALHIVSKNANFIVAFSAEDIDGIEFLIQLRRILFIALLLAVLVTFITGILFARRLVLPIERITREVNLISSKNLSQRVAIDDNRNELTKLAETFNDLLNRLQESFSTQRRFISNASHELSTPLTSISSQLEVAMQKSRSPEEYQEVMSSVYEDIRELQLLTQSLLDIAKTGSQGTIELEEVRLDEVLFKVVADIQRQNKSYKVRLDIDDFPEEENKLTVFGNSNLLYSALKNIIENGCKYSDTNASHVTATFRDAAMEIKVINHGNLISSEDIQFIFQPFFRANDAQGKPGFGLGLTLARGILSLHKGTIQVISSKGSGTVFTVELPNITILS
ncbi:MAG: HAMP domain-containing histidine kinase [Bacteroidetes bacterium]|nr:HAMP domain-containing histidine kinase [Bacteroidota bacterium]